MNLFILLGEVVDGLIKKCISRKNKMLKKNIYVQKEQLTPWTKTLC